MNKKANKAYEKLAQNYTWAIISSTYSYEYSSLLKIT
jgi:hypothetical protein